MCMWDAIETYMARKQPMEFEQGATRKTLAIDGSETFDVQGEPAPGTMLNLIIHRKTGETLEVPVKCRLDTAEEVGIYGAGGVLQRFARDLLEESAAA